LADGRKKGEGERKHQRSNRGGEKRKKEKDGLRGLGMAWLVRGKTIILKRKFSKRRRCLFPKGGGGGGDDFEKKKKLIFEKAAQSRGKEILLVKRENQRQKSGP